MNEIKKIAKKYKLFKDTCESLGVNLTNLGIFHSIIHIKTSGEEVCCL